MVPTVHTEDQFNIVSLPINTLQVKWTTTSSTAFKWLARAAS